MNQIPMFDMNALPEKVEAPRKQYRYYLYFVVDSIRHYMYERPNRDPRNESHFVWMTEEEAVTSRGKPRKKWGYNDSASANRMHNHWQRRAKDGILVRIEVVEVQS